MHAKSMKPTATQWVLDWLQEEAPGYVGDGAYLLNRRIERGAQIWSLQELAHFIDWSVTEEILKGLGGIQLRLVQEALAGVDFKDIAESYAYAAEEREAMERNQI